MTADAAQQQRRVVAGLSGLHRLAERLDAGDHGLHRRAQPDELDRFTGPHLAALDRPGHDRAAAGDGQGVLHGHQERRIDVPLGYRQVGVNGVEQVQDRLDPALLAGQRRQRGDPHHGHLVADVEVRLVADVRLLGNDWLPWFLR